MSTAESTVSPDVSFGPEKRTILWSLTGTAIAALLLVGLWYWLPVQDYLRAAVDWIDSRGPISILVFFFVYVACALVGVPRTLFNISAGFLFSFPIAVGAVLVAAGTTYTLSFLIARNFAREWVQQRIAKYPYAECLLEMVNEEGFKIVSLIRLNPLLPAIITGYGLGTTSISFKTYITASMLGAIPVALTNVYVGWAGGRAMLHDNGGPTVAEQWLLYGGIAVSIIFVGVMYIYGKRAVMNFAKD